MEKTIRFAKGEDTKGTWKYEEIVADGETPIVGRLYLKKPLVKEMGDPAEIVMTLNFAPAALSKVA